MANVNYRNASPNRGPTAAVNYDNAPSVHIPMEPVTSFSNTLSPDNNAPNPSSNPSSPLIRRTRNRRSVSPNNNAGPNPQPLLESDLRPDNNQPPLAGPEIDDLDDNDVESVRPYPGVDDGFVMTPANDNRPGVPSTENFPNNIPAEYPNAVDNRPANVPPRNDPGNVPRNDPRVPVNTPDKRPLPNDGYNPAGNYPVSPGFNPGPFPYAPGYGPPNNNGPGVTASGIPREDIPDVNLYQHKKTLAQGMMDLALFSANANQLRYVLETFSRHPYYYPSIVLITLSLLLQVAVGVGLIWNSRYDVKNEVDICIANKVNNYTVIGIFIVTVINVFISAFGVANSS